MGSRLFYDTNKRTPGKRRHSPAEELPPVTVPKKQSRITITKFTDVINSLHKRLHCGEY